MRANPGMVGVNDNWNEAVKVLRLDRDHDRLRALGVSSQAVRQPFEERSTITRLSEALVPTAGGAAVPIAQLARVQFVWEPGVVWREGREWAIMVQSDVVEGIQGPTVSAQVDEKLAAIRRGLPAGYRVTV